MNTTIQIRIDAKTKKEANKMLKDMGLDLSSGIKLFIHQMLRKGALPFQVRTVNGFTPEYEKMLIKEGNDALKYGKSYTSVEEMFDDILKD